MKLAILAAFSILALSLLTGCHSLAGAGYSAHTIRDYSPETGKLVRKETKRDGNVIASNAILTRKEASAFTHERTNLTGTTSKTGIGSIVSDPDADAIKATGGAVGEAGRALISPKPAPSAPPVP